MQDSPILLLKSLNKIRDDDKFVIAVITSMSVEVLEVIVVAVNDMLATKIVIRIWPK